nr:hypothetical protein CFP56_14140 [Quercus suber]
MLIDKERCCWIEDVVDNNFIPHEARMIKSITLCFSNAEDKLYWPSMVDRAYSIKAGYRFLIDDELIPNDEPKPISIYHPTVEELSASMGTPMEGFFDGVDIVFATPTPPAVACGVSAKTPILSTELIPIGEDTHMERVSEIAPTLAPVETLTPQEGIIPSLLLKQRPVKDGSSLVVTPSSIPSSATRGPNVDLSSEGFEDVVEDLDYEPTMKKRISNSDEEESVDPETEFMDVETSKKPIVVADIGMPTVAPPAITVAPIFVIPIGLVFALPTAPILTSPSSIPTVPSQFEVGSSSVTVPNPVSEVATFFTHFDQPEVNDLDLVDFWSSEPPYVDVHGFRVPEDYASHLVAVYSSCGELMQGFHLGRSAREHFLKMLGSVMNEIEHNFVDTVYTERILQWRAVIQELVSVGFAVEFILDHLR